MKCRNSLVLVHVLWYPCCKHSTQNQTNIQPITSLKFYDSNYNCYSSDNIKDVWSIQIAAQIKHTFRIKYLMIKTLKDCKTANEQQVLFGYTNKKNVIITTKLYSQGEHYNFDNEIAIHHNFTNSSAIQLQNGQWKHENNTKSTIELLVLAS
ncbi:hypothetical protein [Kordia sp.]|uniref:hypothetical protein n=1 Tax=Kordia sp. TaxID=1965332 RepID=UPI003B59E6C4